MQNDLFWIEKLGLKPHPEGGYYREVYRSQEIISKKCLPGRYTSFRSFCTSIYFLLTSKQISAFHRIKSDEIWHFYAGTGLTIYMLFPDGKLNRVILGPDPLMGQNLQIIIPKGCWFAAEVIIDGSYTLAGCTVAPGFDFEDFEMGEKDKLLYWFKEHRNLIERFCIKQQTTF